MVVKLVIRRILISTVAVAVTSAANPHKTALLHDAEQPAGATEKHQVLQSAEENEEELQNELASLKAKEAAVEAKLSDHHRKSFAQVTADGTILQETENSVEAETDSTVPEETESPTPDTEESSSNATSEEDKNTTLLQETARRATLPHSPASTSHIAAEVSADGTVRRSAVTPRETSPGADGEPAKKHEAVRASRSEGKAPKGKGVEKGAMRVDQQIQNEAEVGSGGGSGSSPDVQTNQLLGGALSRFPGNVFFEASVDPSTESGLWFGLAALASLSPTWTVTCLLLIAMAFFAWLRSKGSNRKPAWQHVGLVDSFLSKQFELRREVAQTEGWEKNFPHRDIPSSMCNGIAFLDRAPSRKWFEQNVTKLAKKAPRFAATFMGDPQVWEPVAQLDLNYHIVEHGEVSSKRARDELMQALLYKEAVIDTEKPLWRFHIIPCRADDACLIFQFSHAIGDAVSVVPLLCRLMGTDKDGKPFELMDDNVKRALQARTPSMFMACCYKITSFLKALPHLAEAFSPPEALKPETRLPCHNPERFLDVPFSGPLSLTPASQRLLNFPLVPIKYVKDLKNKARLKKGFEACTVNDILFSVYLGTLRRYCEDYGPGLRAPDQEIIEAGKVVKNLFLRGCQLHNTEAMMKIANGQELEVGNTFEFFIGQIGDGFGQATACERLMHVVQAFDKEKRSGGPYARRMANGLLPYAMKDPKGLVPVLAQLHKKITFYLSAVALPEEKVYIEGIEVREFRGVYHDNIPTVVSISYGDSVAMGVNVCVSALKGWEKMPRFFVDELKELGQTLEVSTAPLKNLDY